MSLLREIYKDDEPRMKAYMAKHIAKMNKISTVKLYIGERVLLTQNLMKDGLANGSQGIITKFEEDGVEVEFQPENIKKIIKPIIRYNKTVHELYSEKMPLIPAYALTIHKAQGMTIRTPLFINMENLWNLELLYVAISRVSDDKLLSLYNPPITTMECAKFR